MARRIDIVVPDTHKKEVEAVLSDPNKCNINDSPALVNSLAYNDGKTLFQVTVPGKNIAGIISHMERAGIGSKVGSISLVSLDMLKPRFVRHKQKALDGSIWESIYEEATMETKFRDFRKPPLTLDEVYGNVVVAAHMTTTSWINLLGASLIAAGGALTNNVVFVVAAMLVSPIMGPILGIAFSYRVKDWKLMRHSFQNLIFMTVSSFLVGFFAAMPLNLYNYSVDEGDRYYPESSVIRTFATPTKLIFSAFVASSAGVILGNAVLKASGSNSLIGIAISAGLLPPIVYSGMLLSFGLITRNQSDSADENQSNFFDDDNYFTGHQFLQDSGFTIIAYCTHLTCIAVFSNILFKLKSVAPKLREVDDLYIGANGKIVGMASMSDKTMSWFSNTFGGGRSPSDSSLGSQSGIDLENQSTKNTMHKK